MSNTKTLTFDQLSATMFGAKYNDLNFEQLKQVHEAWKEDSNQWAQRVETAISEYKNTISKIGGITFTSTQTPTPTQPKPINPETEAAKESYLQRREQEAKEQEAKETARKIKAERMKEQKYLEMEIRQMPIGRERAEALKRLYELKTGNELPK